MHKESENIGDIQKPTTSLFVLSGDRRIKNRKLAADVGKDVKNTFAFNVYTTTITQNRNNFGLRQRRQRR